MSTQGLQGGESDLQIRRESAGLLVIDVQERLAAAMPALALAAMQRNIVTLIKAAQVLGLPILVSEQYPKGLGPTSAAISAVLPAGGVPLTKMAFSIVGEPAIVAALSQSGRRQWLVCGMETHVCVFQSVRDMVGRGLGVFVAGDAVVSRSPENRQVGLDLCARCGAVVSSTETLLFDLLVQAGTSEFKAISALVR